jgi:hypothetical protein
MFNVSSLPLVQPLTAENEPIKGEFASKVIALQYFAEIRDLFPKVNWTGIARTVSHYSAVIESGFITDSDTRDKVKQAKEHLSKILQLEILKADNFLDVPCSLLLGDEKCKPTCGCTDEDSPNCCCPDANFRDSGLHIVWLNSMTVTAYNAQNKDLELEKHIRRGLCWYDIPENAAKLKIRLKWWDVLNSHEIDLQNIE